MGEDDERVMQITGKAAFYKSLGEGGSVSSEGSEGDEPGFHSTLDWRDAETIVQRAVQDVMPRAWSMFGAHSIEDLRQEGMEAFIRASRDFKGAFKVPFPVYARKAVSFALLRYLRATDPLPERTRRDLRKVTEAEDRLFNDGAINPSLSLLSKVTGLTPCRIQKVKRDAYASIPLHPEEVGSSWDFPGLTGDTPEDRYLLWESRERIRKTIKGFTTRQREVFQMRYIEKQPLAEVADSLQVSKGRVSQISISIESLLRQALEGEGEIPSS